MIPEDPMFSSNFSPRSGIEEKIKTAIKLHDEGAEPEGQREEIGLLMMYYKQLLEGTYRQGMDKLSPEEAELELMSITADPAYQMLYGRPERSDETHEAIMGMMDAFDKFMERKMMDGSIPFGGPVSSGDPLYDMLFNDDEGPEEAFDLFMGAPMQATPDMMLPPGLREAFGEGKFMRLPGMPGGFIIGRPIRMGSPDGQSLRSLFENGAEPDASIEIDATDMDAGEFKNAVENALRNALSGALSGKHGSGNASGMGIAMEGRSIFEAFLNAASNNNADRSIVSLAYKPASDVDGKPSSQVLVLLSEEPSGDTSASLRAAVVDAMENFYTAPTVTFTTSDEDMENFCNDPAAGRIMKMSIGRRIDLGENNAKGLDL